MILFNIKQFLFYLINKFVKLIKISKQILNIESLKKFIMIINNLMSNFNNILLILVNKNEINY